MKIPLGTLAIHSYFDIIRVGIGRDDANHHLQVNPGHLLVQKRSKGWQIISTKKYLHPNIKVTHSYLK